MNFIKVFSLVVCLCVCVFFTQTLWAQSASVKIYVTDGLPGDFDSLTLGYQAGATYNIDTTLGEREIPPAPPTFDARSVSIPGKDNLGAGAHVNYHPFTRLSQTDKFLIEFKSDTFGNAMTFSWPAGLASVGRGFWRLYESDGVTQLVDMTTTTSYQYHTNSNAKQQIMMIMGDARGYRTATSNDLATAADSKGKIGNPEKPKPYASYACFAFPNGATDPARTGIHIEFKQTITSMSVSNGWTTASGSSVADLAIGAGTAVNAGGSLMVCAYGDKGKALTVSKWHWADDPTGKPAAPAAGVNRLLLKMPNYVNMLNELYAQGFFPTGLQVGSSATQSVIHPKDKDVLKTLYSKKVGQHPVGLVHCLDFDGKGKPITKQQKTAPPDKLPNDLIAQLVTLKVNMAMNDNAKVKGPNGALSSGFSSLVYNGSQVIYRGKTIATIAAQADGYLSCDSTVGNLKGGTAGQLLAVLTEINNAFSFAFDTAGFGAKTVLTGKALASVSALYSTTDNAPVIVDNWVRPNDVPVNYALLQNYPNPFNPTTTIEFNISEDAFVTLKVYNMLGQEVATLADHEEFSEGNNDVTFDASRLASGVYYYRLMVNDGQFQQVKKMMLLK